MRKYSIVNPNIIVLQTIPRDHTFVCHHSGEEFSGQIQPVRMCIVSRRVVAGIIAPWSDELFGRVGINIRNVTWMRIAHERLISLIDVGDMGEYDGKRYIGFGRRKSEPQF
jgi:hypothetical protein